MKKKLRQLAPIIVLCLYWPALFILTHIPRVPNIALHSPDYFMHFVAYFILTILFWVAARGFERPSLRKSFTYKVIVLFALYALMDELTQTFVGRSCSEKDLISDCVGVLIALLVLYLWSFRVRRLIMFWAGFFVTVHWPELFGLLRLPDSWDAYRMVYFMGGYIGLTLLWCRVIAESDQFKMNRRVLFWSMVVLPAYVLLDSILIFHLAHRIDYHYVVNGIVGIGVGLLAVSFFARHERLKGVEARA